MNIRKMDVHIPFRGLDAIEVRMCSSAGHHVSTLHRSVSETVQGYHTQIDQVKKLRKADMDMVYTLPLL
jgi:hypothetical protein